LSTSPVAAQPPAAGAVHVDVRAPLGAAERDCVRAMIRAVLAHHSLTTDGTRVRLTGPTRGHGPALV